MPLFDLTGTVRDYQVVSAPDALSERSGAKPVWPEGKRFAFSIFDDPDAQSLQQSKIVYSFLSELGLMTTKGIWMLEPRVRNSGGETCEARSYLRHVQQLAQRGFEPGYHSGAPGDLNRVEVIRSLDLFQSAFEHDPVTMANHYNVDAMYWGNSRVTGMRRLMYIAATRGGNPQFFGAVPGHTSFWGDVCRERVGYCRNFVTRNINTLQDFPFMPYYDAKRPFVQAWYGSTEGANYDSFVHRIRNEEQDRLEEEGGACIMYCHFGHGFFTPRGRLQPRFVQQMERLAGKNGWFVPVGTVLNFLRNRNGIHPLSSRERALMERRWLISKLRHGTS